MIEDLDLEVHIEREQPRASILIAGLASRLGAEIDESSDQRRSRELRIFVPAGEPAQPRNGRLVMLLARAALAREKLFATDAGDELTADRELRRLARFAFLAPDIVAAILEGRQPASLAAWQLARMPELPLDWVEQRRILGFA